MKGLLAAMGHFITGLVAEPKLLEAFALQKSLHRPVALSQGLAFLPLRDQDIDSFIAHPLSGCAEDFTYLSAQLAAEVANASNGGPVVYVETEYFGGTGAQGAAVFSGGSLVYGPKSAAIGPINEALRLVGVIVAPSAADEFEAVGLNRHRHTEDWLAVED